METVMCRICLAKNVRMNWIVNTELQHVYETLTNQLLQREARPLVACYICYAQLQHCSQLRVRCLKAEKILTKIINGDQDCYVAENDSLNPGKLLSVTEITQLTCSDVFRSDNTRVKEEPVSEVDDNEEITPEEVEVVLNFIQKTEPSPEPDLSESTSQVDEEHYQTPCRTFEDELPLAKSHIQKLDTNNKTGHVRKDKTAIQKRQEKPDRVLKTNKTSKLGANNVKAEDLKKSQKKYSTSKIESALSISTHKFTYKIYNPPSDIDDSSNSSDITHSSDSDSSLPTENQENVSPRNEKFVLLYQNINSDFLSPDIDYINNSFQISLDTVESNNSISIPNNDAIDSPSVSNIIRHADSENKISKFTTYILNNNPEEPPLTSKVNSHLYPENAISFNPPFIDEAAKGTEKPSSGALSPPLVSVNDSVVTETHSCSSNATDTQSQYKYARSACTISNHQKELSDYHTISSKPYTISNNDPEDRPQISSCIVPHVPECNNALKAFLITSNNALKEPLLTPNNAPEEPQLTFNKPLPTFNYGCSDLHSERITSNNSPMINNDGIEKTPLRPFTHSVTNNDEIMKEAPSCSSGTNVRSTGNLSNLQNPDVEESYCNYEFDISGGSKDRDYVPSTSASLSDDQNDLVMKNECLDGLREVTSSPFNNINNIQKSNNDGRQMRTEEDIEDEEEINEEDLEANKKKTQNKERSEDSLKGERIRERDLCFYCENHVLNFARHLVRNHIAEPEVQFALSHPKKSLKRKTAFSDLRKKGNYISYSQSCFKPVKKSRFSDKSDYLPCSKCLGFYSKKQLWKHVKKCNNTASKNNAQVEAQNFLVRHVKVDKNLVVKVFSRMKPDKVSLIAKKDKLICMFGAHYLRTHRKEHSATVVSRKMRELAKLLIEVTKLKPNIESFEQMLKPQYYNTLVHATKIVARFNNETRQFSAATYAMNIAASIKQCCSIALLQSSKTEATIHTASIQADLKTLSQLITENWKFDISSEAADDLNVKKLNNTTIVPLATDLKMFKDYVCTVSKQASVNLTQIKGNEIVVNMELELQEEPRIDNLSVPETEQPPPLQEDNTNKSREKKKRTLVPWTTEQKDVVNKFFKQHINIKKPPKRGECDELKNKYPTLLHNKDWLKIKVFVQNKYSKT